MARRKFRNQRSDTLSLRNYTEYLFTDESLNITREELLRVIRGGEDTYLELKVKLSNPSRAVQEIVALANTGGGMLIFGVSDQLRIEGLDEPDIVRDELVQLCRHEITPPLVPYVDLITFDTGKRIVALNVVGKQRPYRTRDGRYFVRYGADKREASREELAALLDDSRLLTHEDAPAPLATLADIDEGYLWSFARFFDGDAYDAARTADFSNAELLERDLLLATRTGDTVTPTLAGLLLFGRAERVATLLPQAAVRCTRYAGDNLTAPVIEDTRIVGNLATLFEGTLAFLRRYVEFGLTKPRRTPTPATPTPPNPLPTAQPPVARYAYHRAALTEAVVNLLTHRDLFLRDIETRVRVFDKFVELVNPRRTAGFSGVAGRSIRFGIPHALNPRLAAIFHSSAYGLTTHELPTGGLPMLLRESRLFANRRTDLHLISDEFRLRMAGV